MRNLFWLLVNAPAVVVPPNGSGSAVFGGGLTAGGPTNQTSIYTYATNSRAGGANLGTARYGLAAAGNSTVGIFGGGYTTASAVTGNTDVYTYSGSAVAPGTVLTTASFGSGAASSSPGGGFS